MEPMQLLTIQNISRHEAEDKDEREEERPEGDAGADVGVLPLAILSMLPPAPGLRQVEGWGTGRGWGLRL